MTRTISLAMLEGSAPGRMASAVLALSLMRTARAIEPKAQPAASFAGLFYVWNLGASSVLSQCRTETSTRWRTCAVMHCTESCVVCAEYREQRGTLINAGDLL